MSIESSSVSEVESGTTLCDRLCAGVGRVGGVRHFSMSDVNESIAETVEWPRDLRRARALFMAAARAQSAGVRVGLLARRARVVGEGVWE